LIVRFFGSIQKKYLVCLGGLVLAMFLLAVFGARGLWQIHRLQDERQKIRVSNEALAAENRRLADQVTRMRNHKKEEVERIAREDFGLVKKGEVVYQFEK
jgi:cell division protein FtsB